MSECQRVRSSALDAVIEGREMPAEVSAHAATCTACATDIEANRAVWLDLAKMPAPVMSASRMANLANQLQHHITNQPREAPMKATWLAAAVLAGAVLGGTGMELLRSGTPANGDQPQYLLLLHEVPAQMKVTPENLNAVIGEYSAWAERLRSDKQLVAAEKLRDDAGRWIAPGGALASVDRPDIVSGYFVIRADTYEDAVTIAKASPHLKYGGTIEVRGIEDVSAR